MKRRLTAMLMVMAMALVCLGGQCFAEQTYEMQPIESITQAGDYSIKMDMTDLQTERAIEEGWWYYWTDSAETPAPYYSWETAAGMVTALNVWVNVTNLKSEAAVLADRFMVSLHCMKNGEELVLPGTMFQENPGQVDEDGYTIRSTSFLRVDPGESAKVGALIDIPREVYDLLMDDGNTEPAEAAVVCDDGNTYLIDLHRYMLRDSYDDEAEYYERITGNKLWG